MDGSTANLLRRFLQRAPDALTDEELLTLLLHGARAQRSPGRSPRGSSASSARSARPSPPRRKSWPAWRGWMHRGRCCCGS